MAGFTQFDNELLEKVLASDLTKRQLKILLLIIRFSSGYQKSYAVLRRNDYAYAGVSQYCITEELKKLVRKRVLKWDARRDLVWINPNTREWAVDNRGEKAVSFFKLATKNSMKQQLSVYQNSNLSLAEMTTPYIDRKKLKKDKERLFLKILRDYFLKVAPLTETEMFMLGQVVESFSPRDIEQAIDAVSVGDDRSFPYFLKTLDAFTAEARRTGGPANLKTSLQSFWKRHPKA